MRSTQKTRVYLKLGQAGPPFREFWKLLFPVEDKPQIYSGTFTMDAPDDPGIEMAFHIGGQLARLTPAPFTVCLDDIRVDDPQYAEVPEPVPPPIPNVLVNQVGYFPGLAKIATVKNPNAVPWELLEREGRGRRQGDDDPVRRRQGVGRPACRSSTSRRTPRRAPATRCAWQATSATRSTSATIIYAQAEVRRARVLLPAAQRHPD